MGKKKQFYFSNLTVLQLTLTVQYFITCYQNSTVINVTRNQEVFLPHSCAFVKTLTHILMIFIQ